MKIVAITQDQLIVIDGSPAYTAAIGGYQMTNGEWAVHFDTVLGVGHIEYTDSRENEPLDAARYESSYKWLEGVHAAYLDWKAEQELLRQQEIAERNQVAQDEPSV